MEAVRAKREEVLENAGLIWRERELSGKLRAAERRLFDSEHPEYVDPDLETEEWLTKWSAMREWLMTQETIRRLLIDEKVDQPE